MVIYFMIYHPNKSITKLNLYYEKFIGRVEEYEGKKYLMVDDYALDKVWDKIKRIDIKKLDSTKILANTGDKLPHAITLKMLWY